MASPLGILVREPDTASLFSGPPAVKRDPRCSGVAAGTAIWSPDGSVFATVLQNGVTIYDGLTGAQVGKIETTNTVAAAFSPKSTFLATFQRPIKDPNNAEKNLKLWEWRTGRQALQLFQKAFSKDAWPSIQMSPDERLAFHLVTNTVNAYDPSDFAAGVQHKLFVKGVGGFAICPAAGKPLIAAFVPESKNSPGFAGVYDYSQLGKASETVPPIVRRSFFRATSVRLLWSSRGSAVLALTASDTDATNQSYYGEQKLHFLAADGSTDCLVPLPKEGTIHDVKWAPAGDCFVTVAGFIPSKVTVFSDKCKIIADLGQGGFNLAQWNPHGHFLALAGFGNMAGDLQLQEYLGGGKFQLLTNTRAENGVSAEWSPGGRHLLVATIAPRLRVDNGFRIFKYSGLLIHDERFPVLLEASWRPAPPGQFEDRPASPRSAKKAASEAASSSQALPPQPAPRAAGYVPPQKRGQAPTIDAVKGVFSAHRGAIPPGCEAPKGPSKNAKRRASKKKNAAAGGSGDGQGDEDEEPASASAQATETTGVASLSIGSGPSDPSADTAKRIRALQKKIGQIEGLKEKKSKGAKLEPEQEAKIAGEADLQKQLSELEALAAS